MKIFLQFVAICFAIAFLCNLAVRDDKTLFVVASSVLVLFLGAWIVVRRTEARAWKNRAQRLCTNCLVQAQPLQKQNGVLYCPHCQADNPAPLESPFARDYFARQQQAS